MRSQNIATYIYFGLSWRYLQDADVAEPVHGKSFILDNVAGVLESLDKFGLHVTLRAASELRDLQEELHTAPQGATLTSAQVDQLNRAMQDLQRTLAAEGKGIFTYIVTDKRLDTRKLLDKPGELFAPGVYERLPDVARHDFAEAAKCIAFERATAAAFHVLRGTEDVLRRYYCAIVKKRRVKPLLWFAMVDGLRKRRASPSAELLQNLDNIRQSYRNPTQHPDKIYDLDEVQDLYSICIDAVNRMARAKVW